MRNVKPSATCRRLQQPDGCSRTPRRAPEKPAGRTTTAGLGEELHGADIPVRPEHHAHHLDGEDHRQHQRSQPGEPESRRRGAQCCRGSASSTAPSARRTRPGAIRPEVHRPRWKVSSIRLARAGRCARDGAATAAPRAPAPGREETQTADAEREGASTRGSGNSTYRPSRMARHAQQMIPSRRWRASTIRSTNDRGQRSAAAQRRATAGGRARISSAGNSPSRSGQQHGKSAHRAGRVEPLGTTRGRAA